MKKKPRRYLMWLLLFSVNLSLLSGCIKKPKEMCKIQKSSNQHMFKIALIKDFPSLDPHELSSRLSGSTFGKWIFEGLTRLNLKGEYELAGAEKVDVSPCQTQYTFILRSQFYSNGTPVSAYDYERAWKRALSPDSKCAKASFFYCIKNAEAIKNGIASLNNLGVKAVNDKTLIVNLEYPTPYFLKLVSSSLFAPFKKKGDEILLNGPYTIDEWKKNDCLALKVNPFFWDRKRIHIKNIKMYIIEDPMTAFSLYENKEVDLVGGPFNLLPSDILTSVLPKGTFSKEKDMSLPFWVYLNTKHSSLSSKLIRRALSCIIDRNEIAKHILVGDIPLFTPFPKTGLSDEAISIDHDLIKGKALFEQGLEDLGLTRDTFPPLKLSSCNYTFHKKLAEYLQEKWQQTLGIQVDLEIQEWSTFYSNLARGNYQAAGILIPSEYDDPIAYLELLSSSSNFSQWDSPEYKRLIRKIKQEKDLSLRSELSKRAEEFLLEETPIIWIVNRSHYYSYRPDLKGLCFDHQGLFDLSWAYFVDHESD